jgi:hypothetical protein
VSSELGVLGVVTVFVAEVLAANGPAVDPSLSAVVGGAGLEHPAARPSTRTATALAVTVARNWVVRARVSLTFSGRAVTL